MLETNTKNVIDRLIYIITIAERKENDSIYNRIKSEHPEYSDQEVNSEFGQKVLDIEIDTSKTGNNLPYTLFTCDVYTGDDDTPIGEIILKVRTENIVSDEGSEKYIDKELLYMFQDCIKLLMQNPELKTIDIKLTVGYEDKPYLKLNNRDVILPPNSDDILPLIEKVITKLEYNNYYPLKS